MDSLFNPRKAVHFALENDEEEDDITVHHSTSLHQSNSQPSSSQPGSSSSSTPHSTSHSPYTDDDPNTSPLFDLDDTPTTPTAESLEASYYPPKPLKSTIPSREAEFELDSDDIDTDEQLEEPLMEGLLDSGAKRGSLDLRRERRGKDVEEGGAAPDWTKGAGVFAGIANMSNSILGAGIIGEFLRHPQLT